MIRTKWYNYIIGGVFITLLTILLTRFIFIHPITRLMSSGRMDLYFIGINISFIPMVLAVLLVQKLYHKKNYTPSFKQLFIGFGLWLAMLIFSLLIILLWDNHNLEYSFKPPMSLTILLLSIMLTPLQVLAEEMIFRGYLIDLLHSISQKKVFKLLISSLLFALPHLANPEVNGDYTLFFLIYFSMGLVLAYLTITYKSISYATGVHFANNFFAINLVNYPDSPIPSLPLFMDLAPVEPLPTLIQILIFSSLIVIIIKKIEKHDFLSEKK